MRLVPTGATIAELEKKTTDCEESPRKKLSRSPRNKTKRSGPCLPRMDRWPTVGKWQHSLGRQASSCSVSFEAGWEDNRAVNEEQRTRSASKRTHGFLRSVQLGPFSCRIGTASQAAEDANCATICEGKPVSRPSRILFRNLQSRAETMANLRKLEKKQLCVLSPQRSK